LTREFNDQLRDNALPGRVATASLEAAIRSITERAKAQQGGHQHG
jgi:hypothetical protein